MNKLILQKLAYPFVAFALFVVIIVLASITNDANGLRNVGIAAGLFQLGVIMVMLRSSRFSIALFFLNLNNLMQCFFIAIYFNNINDGIVPGFGFDLSNYATEQMIGLIIIPSCSLFIFPFFVKKNSFKEINSIFQLVLHPERSYFVILWIYSFTILFSLYFNRAGLGGLIGYVSLLSEQSTLLVPILIGIWYKKLSPTLRTVSLLSVSAQVGLTILTGNRFIVFLDVLLLYFGFLIASTQATRRFLMYSLLLIIPALMSVLGLMGLVRDKIGRGTIQETFSEDRYDIYKTTFFEYLESSETDETVNDESEKNSTGRNINFVNTVVFANTPKIIPYRGFDNLPDELLNIFRLTAINSGFDQKKILESGDENVELGFGNGMAKRYGYNVTSTNGVEWSLLADAWSRGGVLGCYLFILFFVLLTEKLKIFISNVKLPEVKILLFIIFLNLIFFSPTTRPLPEFIKYVFLRGLASYLLLSVIFIFFRQKKQAVVSGEVV